MKIERWLILVRNCFLFLVGVVWIGVGWSWWHAIKHGGGIVDWVCSGLTTVYAVRSTVMGIGTMRSRD